MTAPGTSANYSSVLCEAFDDGFGSFDKMRAEFTAASKAVFGSGYVRSRLFSFPSSVHGGMRGLWGSGWGDSAGEARWGVVGPRSISSTHSTDVPSAACLFSPFGDPCGLHCLPNAGGCGWRWIPAMTTAW